MNLQMNRRRLADQRMALSMSQSTQWKTQFLMTTRILLGVIVNRYSNENPHNHSLGIVVEGCIDL